MAAGGIYDHVGGGFHRYSTDAHWLVPHFEKMLYDNAQLAVAYLEGYGRSHGRPSLPTVLRVKSSHYVAREMTASGGWLLLGDRRRQRGDETGKFRRTKHPSPRQNGP